LRGVVVAHATTLQQATAVLNEAGHAEVAKEIEQGLRNVEEEER
jgi:hypothetical protein